MTSNTGVWLEDLTWPEARDRFAAGALVVIPIGAAAKAHGPHLPLKTDALTARALAQRLIERLPVVAAPVVGFGFYPAFTAFAGSQHLSPGTFKAVLSELLANLRSHGVRRLAILNTGVSTEKPVDEVAAAASDLLVLHMRGLGAAAEGLLDVAEGGHADERETSVMLALDPRSVRMDRLAPEGPFERTAATGDASRATAFKGERILAARVEDMVAVIVGRWPDLRATPAMG
jgi:creatinine amidohydrolase/Fe(II)-dependent formamide hydrolase-like protein